MSYLQFHLVFLAPPLLLMALLTAKRGEAPLAGTLQTHDRRSWLAFWLMPLIALLYTTPWDNYLVWRGVWGYPAERVLGYLGYVPYEEYLFFILQSLLGGLWLFWLLRRSGRSPLRRARWRWPVAVFWLALSVIGAALLFTRQGLYLGLILAWAAPVLGLQWAVGGDVLARLAPVRIRAILPLALYLGAADRLAIEQGIWQIFPRFSTGAMLWGLPIEEALFFLLTTGMVVNGLLLLIHPTIRQRVLKVVLSDHSRA